MTVTHAPTAPPPGGTDRDGVDDQGDGPEGGPSDPPPSDPSDPVRPHRLRTLLLAAGAYLVASVAVWWNVWSSHPTSVTTCGCGDTSLFTWFLAWPAYAIAHGLNPLYSQAMFHPGGVNLLSNTSEVGIGVLLAPVTWIWGPVATLNVALTLSPVLSALAMFVLLRRWVAWSPAAFVGGLLYGFSPLFLISLTDAHLMVGMGVVPPLVVLCLDELLIRQRRRPVRTGVGLGLLVAVQFFLGTEALVIMAIGVVIGVVLVAGYGYLHRATITQDPRAAGRGLLAGVVTSAVLLAYPAAFALAGPAHYSGEIWPHTITGFGGISWKGVLLPSSPSTTFTNLTHQVGGYQGPTLSGQYLGLGVVVVLLGGLLIWRHDRRLWLFGAVTLLTLPLALGRENHFWVPWKAMAHIPLIQNIVPNRFMLIVYLAVAVMVGVIVDHTRSAVLARAGTPPVTRARVAAAVAGLAVAAVAVVPPLAYLGQQVPLTTQRVELPTWFRSVGPHLDGHQVLLVYPVPFALLQSALTWQAVDRMSFSMAGGGGPGSVISRAGSERPGEQVLEVNSLATGAQPESPADIRAVRHALDGWGVTTVVVPDTGGLPRYEQVRSVPSTVALMTAATGEPPVRRANAWVWTGVDHAGPAAVPTADAYLGCIRAPGGGLAEASTVPGCILAAPRADEPVAR